MASTIGQRIREARQSAKLTQAQLGAACDGKTPQAVFFWESGKTIPAASDLLTIARLTNTTIAWLMEGKGGDIVPPIQHCTGRIVPFVPWDFLLSFQQLNLSPTQSVRSHFDCGPRSFATVATDDACAPDIRQGDSVIVDPEQAPVPGDYVLARVDDVPHLRRYQPRADGVHLAASNPDWPSYTVQDWDAARLGTVTEIARPRRS
jgi:transcriptional regulator with XRE-family HTH domain